MQTSNVLTAVRSNASPTSNKVAPVRTNPAAEAAKPSADGDSATFSPDQIDSRAKATTQVLNQILEYNTVARDFRFWGINE